MRRSAQHSTTTRIAFATGLLVAVCGCSESDSPSSNIHDTSTTAATSGTQDSATQGPVTSSSATNTSVSAATGSSTMAAVASTTGAAEVTSATDGGATTGAVSTTTDAAGSISVGGASSTLGETSTDSSTTSTSASSSAGGSGGGANTDTTLSFFVTSQTSETGALGGLSGADATCQSLASAVGAGNRVWRAYLSADSDPDSGGSPVNARDRIGEGPWINANGVTLANNLEELHGLSGDVALFVDENGDPINGQWADSPSPNEHDILTGSTADGMLDAGNTCESWTSDADDIAATVGHSDGLGPNMDSSGSFASWNSSHQNESCADTAPRGGAGKFYCFASD